ncbi:MAG: glycosyltransferase family 39 protein [Anaerolineae bacterium]|nr:glycosyltransferase family 39 protein [Anaerolineae bacterium]
MHRFTSSLLLIILLLLLAAALRIIGLTWLPAGFSTEEITDLRIALAVRDGNIASFYEVGTAAEGHEGLYPLMQGLVSGVLGDGTLNLRMMSVWGGLIGIALVYTLGRRLFGSLAGLVAAAVIAVSLYPLLLARSAIRETLLFPLAAGALLAFVNAVHLRQVIEPESPQTRSYMALGVLTAAMAYTHWTGLFFIPFIVVYFLFLRFTRQPVSRRLFTAAWFALVITIILAIPYLTFTLRSPRLSGLYTIWINHPESIGGFVNSVVNTILAVLVRGDLAIQHNFPGDPLIGILAAALLIMGFIVAIDRRRAANMAFCLLALLFGLMPAMWSRTPPDFTNMILALPALALLVGLGAQWLVENVLHYRYPMRNVSVALLFVVITAASAYLGIRTLFGSWQTHPQIGQEYNASLGYLAAWLDRNNDELTTSVCTFNLENDSLSDPQLLRLMMHRTTNRLRFSNCLTGLVITKGGATQRVAFLQPDAAAVMSPVLKDWVQNSVDVPVQGLPPTSVLQINVEQQLADTLGRLAEGRVNWSPDSSGTSEIAHLPLRMGYNLTFQGYMIVPGQQFKPGDVITLITYWRVDGIQEPDLQIFAHLARDPQQFPIQQNDILSVDATTLWNRDIFIQIIPFAPLPPDFTEGSYFVSVGAYRRDTNERFPVYDDSVPRGNRIFLDPITVTR